MTTPKIRYYIDVEGRSIELPDGEATIGRSRNCTVAVKDVTVSRHHATIWFEAGKAKVRDIGSSNGTYVNGRRVQGESALASGDKVSVGETEMLVRIVAPAESPEATVRIEFGDLFCPRCGAPVPRGASACVACSQLIAAPASGETAPVAPAPSVPLPPLTAPPTNQPPNAPPVAAIAAPVATPPPPPLAPPPPPMPPPSPAFGPLPSAPAPRPSAPPRAPAPPAMAGGSPGVATSRPAAPEPPREMLSSIREIELAAPPAMPAVQARATTPAAFAPAGFWVRFGAYLIDAVAMSVVYLIVAGPLFLMGSYTLGANLGGLTMLAAGLALALVGWGRYGTTPGKHLLGLRVVTIDAKPGQVGIGTTKALIRWLGYMVSGMVLGIGLLLIAFRADKRGLHDLLAGTAVGRRR